MNITSDICQCVQDLNHIFTSNFAIYLEQNHVEIAFPNLMADANDFL
jgi:hypothetical protein